MNYHEPYPQTPGTGPALGPNETLAPDCLAARVALNEIENAQSGSPVPRGTFVRAVLGRVTCTCDVAPESADEVWDLMNSMFEQPAHLVLNKLQPLATRIQRERDALRQQLEAVTAELGHEKLDKEGWIERCANLATAQRELAESRATVGRLEAVLQHANPPPERAYECLDLLDKAGMGKEGAPHGNTLTGMVQEVCETIADLSTRLAQAERERDEARRIYTRCPACHNDTLTINDDKHLLCTWIDCPDPTLIDRSAVVVAADDTARLDWLDRQFNVDAIHAEHEKSWVILPPVGRELGRGPDLRSAIDQARATEVRE